METDGGKRNLLPIDDRNERLLLGDGIQAGCSPKIKRTYQGREGWDAMALAGYLICAMVFSLITLIFIIVAVYRFFRPTA